MNSFVMPSAGAAKSCSAIVKGHKTCKNIMKL